MYLWFQNLLIIYYLVWNVLLTTFKACIGCPMYSAASLDSKLPVSNESTFSMASMRLLSTLRTAESSCKIFCSARYAALVVTSMKTSWLKVLSRIWSWCEQSYLDLRTGRSQTSPLCLEKIESKLWGQGGIRMVTSLKVKKDTINVSASDAAICHDHRCFLNTTAFICANLRLLLIQ